MLCDLKHVALYLPSLRGGGAERMMVTLANGFAARGLGVDLALAQADGPYLGEVAPEVRIVDLHARRVIASLPALVGYLRRERPQALLSAMGHANVVALWARDLARVPTRVVVSERAVLRPYLEDPKGLRGRVLPSLMRRLYRRADRVVAVSGDVALDLRNLLHLPQEHIQVIYNPVVGPDLAARAHASIDHPWFANGEPPVLLGAGRLTAQKDFGTLIRAFARVSGRRSARLMILGEGEQRRELEALAKDLQVGHAVALPGFVENPFAYMSRAALFVLSSRFEGLPGVLIQAMACGSPVVSTDCPGGPTEILEGGRWGRLVPVGDFEALARAIEETLDDPAPPDVRVRANYFDVDRAVDRYLHVLMGS